MPSRVARKQGSRAVAYMRVSMERDDMVSPELQMIAAPSPAWVDTQSRASRDEGVT
jgi:hypothetical protein